MPDGTVVTAELKRYPRADVADALKLRRTCDVNLNLGFDCVFIVPRETEWKLIFRWENAVRNIITRINDRKKQ